MGWKTAAAVLAAQVLALPGHAEESRPAPQTTLGAPESPWFGDPAEGVQVQLGAHDSEDEAMAAYMTAYDAAQDLLGHYTPVLITATSGNRTFFRLRLQGFADLQEARQLCGELQLREISCIPLADR